MAKGRAEAGGGDREGGAPLQILWKRAGRLREALLDVRGGPRHPRLRRLPNRPDRLADILRAR